MSEKFQHKENQHYHGERRTVNIGRHSGDAHCPHCHNAIPAGCELCPRCGHPVADDHCTFCGVPFEGVEQFCSECGTPRAGIPCPTCGNLCFRSFCSRCNTPLNDLAQLALQQAKADPRFQRAQRIADEMASMEAYLLAFKAEIEQAIAEEEAAPDVPALSDEGEQLRRKYDELMKLLGKTAAPAPAQQPVRQPHKQREQLKAKFFDAERIMEAYRQKADEMQQVLHDMIPDPSMTPAQQRDYACARKVAVYSERKERRPLFWTCNLCGCRHDNPSECAEPELGGVWTYQTVTITEKEWRYID